MKKIIIVTSCSSCPYRHSHWSPSVYMGSSCGHRDAEKLGIYGLNDREEIHEKCPLRNVDDILNSITKENDCINETE